MAQIQKVQPKSEVKPEVLSLRLKLNLPKTSGFYQPELNLNTALIKKDLIKSVVVVAVILAIQLGAYVYLANGGWQRLFNWVGI